MENDDDNDGWKFDAEKGSAMAEEITTKTQNFIYNDDP